MAWEATLTISGGTTCTGLVAGAESTGADYGSIGIVGSGDEHGVLNHGSTVSGGTVSVLAGGVATDLTLLGNGATGGSAIISGGTVDGLTAEGKGANIALRSGAVVNGLHVSGGALVAVFDSGAIISGGELIFCKEVMYGGLCSGSRYSAVPVYGEMHDVLIAMDEAASGYPNWVRVYDHAKLFDCTISVFGTRVHLSGSSGETAPEARNTRVDSGAFFYVGAGARLYDTTVAGPDGTQFYVMNTAVAEIVHVSGKAYLQVGNGDDGGGRAVSAYIDSGATATIASGGRAESMFVYVGGSALLNNGGLASETILSGGAMTVNSGGLASGTILSGGTMTVSNGSAFGTILSGGTMTVSNGAVAVGASAVAVGAQLQINGGFVGDIEIRNGANFSLTGGTISGGTIGVGTTQNRKTITDGSIGDVTFDGGNAANRLWLTFRSENASLQSCRIERQARIEVTSGATIVDAVVEKAQIRLVSGAAENTALRSGGILYVAGSGTLAADTVVSSGGFLNLGHDNTNYGTARGNTILSGGSVRIACAACLDDTTIYSGGTVTVWSTYLNNSNTYSGGILGDTVIMGGGTVDFRSGGILSGALTFDLSGQTATNTMFKGGAYLTAEDAADHSLHVAADREGAYTLVDRNVSAAVGGVFRVTVGDEAYTAAHTFGGTVTDWRTGLNYTVEGGSVTTLRTGAYAYTEISTAQSIFAAGNTVTDAKTGGTVYTGRISASNVSGQYFAAGDDAGSRELWLEIAGGTHNGVIAAGAEAGGTVGTGRVRVTGGSTLLLLGGGDLGATQTKAEVIVAGGEVNTLYGGGKQGDYANGISVTVNGTASVTNIYAGVLHTKNNGSFTVGGDVSLTVGGNASITGFTFGGGKVSTNGTASDSVTYGGNINLTVDGGTFGTGVYGLGYAKGTAGNQTALSANAVNASISGGTFNSDVYLGALADKATATAATLTAKVTGGKINGTLYGGGLAQKGGQANAGAVSISVEGGTIDSIVGGGSHVNKDDGNTSTVASVAITVSGGTIEKIYAGGLYNTGKSGYYGADAVTGDAVVTLTGSTAEIGKAAGSWNGFDTVTGDRKLVLDDFTGTCGTICDFDIVTFGSANTANVLSGTTIYNVGHWSFDVRGRETADAAFVDLSSSTLTMSESTTLDLRLASAAEWNLAQVSGSPFEGIDCRVFLGDATTAAATVEFGVAIENTGTAFDGYGFTVVDNTLKFAAIANA